MSLTMTRVLLKLFFIKLPQIWLDSTKRYKRCLKPAIPLSSKPQKRLSSTIMKTCLMRCSSASLTRQMRSSANAANSRKKCDAWSFITSRFFVYANTKISSASVRSSTGMGLLSLRMTLLDGGRKTTGGYQRRLQVVKLSWSTTFSTSFSWNSKTKRTLRSLIGILTIFAQGSSSILVKMQRRCARSFKVGRQLSGKSLKPLLVKRANS